MTLSKHKIVALIPIFFIFLLIHYPHEAKILYPIRKSNKPPYIYWKKLVVAGLALLVITIPLAIMSTEINYDIKFIEQGHVISGERIPKNMPPASVLAGVRTFMTNFTLKVPNCGLRYINVTIYGTNKSIVAEVHQGIASILLPGAEFLNVSVPNECNATYSYIIVELSRPYSTLVFISALTSVTGAVLGVLGTVLFIKQRHLMKAEEKYL